MTSTDSTSSSRGSLTVRLASRVRSARQSLGLPRRELSERSGVSPRYLAQLEAGEGNISILLLDRVASALCVRIEDLLSEQEPLDKDAVHIAGLYRAAPPHTQEQVRAILAPVVDTGSRAGRICLVGLPGAGKTTLGRLAAEKLKLNFVELTNGLDTANDGAICRPQDRVAQSTTLAQKLAKVVEQNRSMILVAPPNLTDVPADFELVLERFHTIWIRTSPAEHAARLRQSHSKQSLSMADMDALMVEHAHWYQRTSAQVDTTSKPVSSALNELLAKIAKNKFLDTKT